MAEVARHVRVTGRVQGVFFRAWAQGQARELGVSGWIRNCPDGSVEAHLGGEEDCVAANDRADAPGAVECAGR